MLECMDYQHLTKDRSLGSVELRVADLAKRVEDTRFPYASTGKKTVADPLRLNKGNVYKGQLHYVAEFVPAVALAGVNFESAGTELDKVMGPGDGSDSSSASGSGAEKEAIPAGITVSRPLDEEYDEIKEEEAREARNSTKGHKKGAKSVDSVAVSVKSNATAGTVGTTGTTTPERTIEMSKEELMSHRESRLHSPILVGCRFLICLSSF